MGQADLLVIMKTKTVDIMERRLSALSVQKEIVTDQRVTNSRLQATVEFREERVSQFVVRRNVTAVHRQEKEVVTGMEVNLVIDEVDKPASLRSPHFANQVMATHLQAEMIVMMGQSAIANIDQEERTTKLVGDEEVRGLDVRQVPVLAFPLVAPVEETRRMDG